MKNFVVDYESEGNLFEGSKLFQTKSLADAQTAFFEWLQAQPVYTHLWELRFTFKEVQ